MKKRKKIINKFIILSTLVVLLSSCGLKVREELKEFTKNFSIDNCMEKYKQAEFSYVSEIKDFNEVTAYRELTYSFNMKVSGEYESILETFNSGLYVTKDYPEYKYQRFSKSSLEGKDYQEEIKTSPNGEISVNSYLDEETFVARLKTFYRRATDKDGGNTAGMYYGDDVISRLRFQDNMRIDTDKNILIYDMKNAVDDKENVTSLYYEVNSDGMLLYWKQSGFTTPYNNPDRTYFAEMVVKYY